MFVLYEGGFDGSSPEIQPLSQFVGCLLLLVRVSEFLFDIAFEVPPADAPTIDAVVIGTFILTFPVGGPGTRRSLLHRGKDNADLVEFVGDVSIGNVTATAAPPDVKSVEASVVRVWLGDHRLSAGVSDPC